MSVTLQELQKEASTCTKCGFNLKGAAAPKFKGTMLMNQPTGAPAIDQQSRAANGHTLRPDDKPVKIRQGCAVPQTLCAAGSRLSEPEIAVGRVSRRSTAYRNMFEATRSGTRESKRPVGCNSGYGTRMTPTELNCVQFAI
jgi:hypothetical protein